MLRSPGSSAIAASTVAEFRKNIFHNGGVACERYAVSEHGITADLRGIRFIRNDYVSDMPGRDLLTPAHRVGLYREARPGTNVDHCVVGGAFNFPACIDDDITETATYFDSVNVDPLLAAADVDALIDAPSLHVIPSFYTSNAALNVGPASTYATTDFEDTPRDPPSTIGHYEQP